MTKEHPIHRFDNKVEMTKRSKDALTELPRGHEEFLEADLACQGLEGIRVSL